MFHKSVEVNDGDLVFFIITRYIIGIFRIIILELTTWQRGQGSACSPIGGWTALTVTAQAESLNLT